MKIFSSRLLSAIAFCVALPYPFEGIASAGIVQNSHGAIDLDSPDLIASSKVADLDSRGRGWLENVTVYGEAWESGDFLVRVRSTFDSVNRPGQKMNLNGAVIEKTEFHRVVFDYKTERFCVLSYKQGSTLDLERQANGLNPKLELESIYGVCLGGDGVIRKRAFPKGIVQMPKNVWSIGGREAVAAVEFPDFRGLAVTGRFGRGGFLDSKKWIENRAEKWSVRSVKEINSDRAEVKLGSTSDKSGESVETWLFDTVSLVPVARKNENDSTKDGSLKKVVTLKAELGWQEISGIFVLASYHRESNYGNASINQKRHSGFDNLAVDFHWFRLNEEVGGEFFDGSLLASMDAFMANVDPKRAGATTLIETLE